MEKRLRFSLGYFLIAVALVFVVHTFVVGEETGQISYAQFKQLVSTGKITDVVIGPEHVSGKLPSLEVEGILSPEQVQRLKQFGGTTHVVRAVKVEDPKLVEELEAHKISFSGRLAEELAFGDISTGAQDDLQRATDIALSMVTQYGMSETLGLRTFERERRSRFLESAAISSKEYSEEKSSAIDAEVEEIFKRSHARVQRILSERRTVLDQIAHRLLEKEVVDGEELRAILGEQVPARAAVG